MQVSPDLNRSRLEDHLRGERSSASDGDGVPRKTSAHHQRELFVPHELISESEERFGLQRNESDTQNRLHLIGAFHKYIYLRAVFPIRKCQSAHCPGISRRQTVPQLGNN